MRLPPSSNSDEGPSHLTEHVSRPHYTNNGGTRAIVSKQAGTWHRTPQHQKFIDSCKMPPPPPKRSDVEHLETPVSEDEPHRRVMVIQHDSSQHSSSWPQDIWLHDQFCRVLYQPVLVFPLSQPAVPASSPVYRDQDQDQAQSNRSAELPRGGTQQSRQMPPTEESAPASLRPVPRLNPEAPPVRPRKTFGDDSLTSDVRSTRPLAETRHPNEKMRRN